VPACAQRDGSDRPDEVRRLTLVGWKFEAIEVKPGLTRKDVEAIVLQRARQHFEWQVRMFGVTAWHKPGGTARQRYHVRLEASQSPTGCAH
jgi:hypothetical protein